MSFRMINFSTESGSREKMIITEELDAPAGDFCPPGFTVDSDITYNQNLPIGFPLGYEWDRL